MAKDLSHLVLFFSEYFNLEQLCDFRGIIITIIVSIIIIKITLMGCLIV